ncbi:unnamed protein product [Caenorhabditis sp. 36 PRJEB53466]|nr:unnamed protein product [Caenorhabditis sp. 36 PRJEB53466]
MAPSLLRFTPEEDMTLWQYLIESTDTVGPVALWKTFKTQTGSQRNVQTLYNRFKYSLAPHLHEADLDMATKAKLYGKYRIMVPSDYVETLKAATDVRIDEQGFVVDAEAPVSAPIPVEAATPDLPVPPPARRASKRTSTVASTPHAKRSAPRAARTASPPKKTPRTPRTASACRNTPRRSALPKVATSRTSRKTRSKVSAPSTPAASSQSAEPPQSRQQTVRVTEFDTAPFFESLKQLIGETTREVVQKTVDDAFEKNQATSVQQTGDTASLELFLSVMKSLVSRVNSPAMQDIDKRIEAALLTISADDKQIPVDTVRSAVDVAIRILGF